jgi:hypothetical protein
MADLPEGYVPLSHFDSKDRGKGDGHSPQYKQLVAAVKAGELRGLQDAKSRRYYVPQDEANRLLIAKAAQAADKPSAKACELAAADSLSDMVVALVEIAQTLQRLTVAAVSIARQPHEPAGSWRDMNGDVLD